ncbi:hypothetical protein TF3313_0768 [Tannerella forsythia 3313]|nr:hypothetical protein TF3313_0768 [Tannerella forsythia 3313]
MYVIIRQYLLIVFLSIQKKIALRQRFTCFFRLFYI